MPYVDGDYTITCSIEDEHGLAADEDASLAVAVVFPPGSDPGDEVTGPDGQTLVWVPAGSFMMGSEDGSSDETPVHQVTLDGFWVGQCEVTNDQYAAFLNEADPADVNVWLDIDDDDGHIEYSGGVYQAEGQWGPHPVVEMNWTGALAYCEYYGYTLPTEAQWEYVAAGPDSRKYPWGSSWDRHKCCNFENRGPLGTTFEVGSFPDGVSWCGALDMAGNVDEFCLDWYDPDYYAASPELNPPGPADGTNRVLHGGCWNDGSNKCRAARRSSFHPTFTNGGAGFRVAFQHHRR